MGKLGGKDPPILSGQQDLGHIDHSYRLARIMHLLDRRGDLDYIRPDRAFWDLGLVVHL
jgi:hypothetical protein